jgi:hypothetical protein
MMDAATLIGLAQIGLAMLLGLLCWRLILAARSATSELRRPTRFVSGGRNMADGFILPADLVAGAIEHMNRITPAQCWPMRRCWRGWLGLRPPS